MFSLQSMVDSKHLKWPVYIMFGLLIISFIFFYGWKSDTNQQRQVDFAEVKAESMNPFVKTQKIGALEMKIAAMTASTEDAKPFGGQVSPAQLREVLTMDQKKQEAANLVLIQRAADRLGIRRTRDDVINWLNQQPGITNAALVEAAQANGFDSVEEFLEALRQSQLRERVTDLIGQVAHASLFELWQQYQLQKEKLTLEVAAYPAKDFEDQVNITDQDLVDYLGAHKDEFHVPAKRQYAYVKLTRDDLKAGIHPTDEQLKAYYQQNQAKYRTLAGSRIEELVIPLSSNPSTTETQKALEVLREARPEAQASQNWTSLSQTLMARTPDFSVYATPETPWLGDTAAGYTPEYLKAVRTQPLDTVSTPVLENGRAAMFRVKERRDAGTQPFEAVRAQVESDYVAQQVGKEFDAAAARWREVLKGRDAEDGETTFTIKSIADFAKAVGRQDQLSTPTAVGTSTLPGIGTMSANVTQTYLPSLKPGEVSDLIQADSGNEIVVLAVKSETDAYDPPLAEVRAEVEKAVRADRAAALAKLKAEQNLTVVRNGADFDTALADAPIKPAEAAPITRDQPVQALGATLTDFRKESAGAKVGMVGMSAYGGTTDHPEGYALWKVKSIEEPTREDFTRDRDPFAANYLQFQQMTVIREWLRDQRKAADYKPLEVGAR